MGFRLVLAVSLHLFLSSCFVQRQAAFVFGQENKVEGLAGKGMLPKIESQLLIGRDEGNYDCDIEVREFDDYLEIVHVKLSVPIVAYKDQFSRRGDYYKYVSNVQLADCPRTLHSIGAECAYQLQLEVSRFDQTEIEAIRMNGRSSQKLSSLANQKDGDGLKHIDFQIFNCESDSKQNHETLALRGR
jgi:hypothetical protein